MPKAYRVLAEKYQTLLEANQPEHEYAVESNNPRMYTYKSYELFAKRCMECSTYEEFKPLCKDFLFKQLPGNREIEMHIKANTLYTALKAVVSANAPLLKNTLSIDELNDAVYNTLVSLTRIWYSPNQAVQNQKDGKEAWEKWYSAYSDYKQAMQSLKKGSEEAGVNLDI